MLKVKIRFQPIGFRAFCKAITDCACIGSLDGIDQYPVLFAKIERPDSPFAGRIINRDIAIPEEYLQIFLLI